MWAVHWGLLLRLSWRAWVVPVRARCGGGAAAWVAGVLAAPGIGQYTPGFLPGEPHSLTEKPGRPQSSGLQTAGHDRSDPARIDTRLFLPVAAVPQWELGMKVVQMLGLQGPSLAVPSVPRTQTASTAGVKALSVFFQASCSWQSEGLFGQFFSVAPPVQALRGLPCLGCFSVVWCIRYIEGPPRLGFYSVILHNSHLKDHPGWGPAL